MKIHFLTRSGPHLASFRLRTQFAADALRAAGHDVRVGPNWAPADIHVFSKHWDAGEFELARRSPCAVYDVCDEHFTSTPAAIAAYPWIREHYHRMCEVARVVTTGSEALAQVIREKTGRGAVVLEEPPEGPELPPKFDLPPKLLWFGHRANLKHLVELGIECAVVTNPQWTPQLQAEALRECDLVLLPQKDKWKSANRAVAALRAGRYAVADPVQSYEGLCWTGGVLEGIEWVKSNPGSIIERILKSQELIRERFSPKRLARQWCDCILAVAESTSQVS